MTLGLRVKLAVILSLAIFSYSSPAQDYDSGTTTTTYDEVSVSDSDSDSDSEVSQPSTLTNIPINSQVTEDSALDESDDLDSEDFSSTDES